VNESYFTCNTDMNISEKKNGIFLLLKDWQLLDGERERDRQTEREREREREREFHF
jgi:hypothetical protein